MFGAETRLMERATDRQVFDGIVGLINNFKEYFMQYGQPIDRNPCPGNIRSGISTDEDKSLGNIQKGGSAPVVDVLYYGDPVTGQGLSLLTGSGNDAVSVTNLTASGANLVLFTTGNGNPFGAVVPTIKISSNTALAGKSRIGLISMRDRCWTDAGLEETAEELFGFMLEVASGKRRQKMSNMDIREISIFRDGVTLEMSGRAGAHAFYKRY